MATLTIHTAACGGENKQRSPDNHHTRKMNIPDGQYYAGGSCCLEVCLFRIWRIASRKSRSVHGYMMKCMERAIWNVLLIEYARALRILEYVLAQRALSSKIQLAVLKREAYNDWSLNGTPHTCARVNADHTYTYHTQRQTGINTHAKTDRHILDARRQTDTRNCVRIHRVLVMLASQTLKTFPLNSNNNNNKTIKKNLNHEHDPCNDRNPMLYDCVHLRKKVYTAKCTSLTFASSKSKIPSQQTWRSCFF